jgi:hypothetical protein
MRNIWRRSSRAVPQHFDIWRSRTCAVMSRMGARNARHGLALVGMARDLVSADLNAARSAIGTELRKLYSDVLHPEIPDRMAELIKQLDQLTKTKPLGREADDP